ncbi:hypothetical protein [Brevibacterium ihuae]|uniref:hypothetical protein n=1 Tax=Brevibacterium ihuae TaxID=1631743 RepID=UPI000C78A647|nr:hypothetical protein [Brevibacterium ihuae]
MSEVLVTARSLGEYVAMFDLRVEDLEGRSVLDCPGGSASAAAELWAAGVESFAIDPLYGGDRHLLADRVAHEVERWADFARTHGERLDWRQAGTGEELYRARVHSAQQFLDDFNARPAHYIDATLPHLPFSDDTFDLAVSSHLLFTYSGMFDAEFHLASLLELARVSREVRAYPLVTIEGHEEPALLDAVTAGLTEAGLVVDRPASAYQRQAKATSYLRITRR